MPSPSTRAISKDKLISLYRQAVLGNIPLDTVQQKIDTFLLRSQTTLKLEEKDDRQHLQKIKKKGPLLARVFAHSLPIIFVSLGIFLVGNAAWPILSYFVFTSPDLSSTNLLAPIPREQVLEARIPGVTQVQAQGSNDQAEAFSAGEVSSIEPTILNDQLDYSNLSNWFPESSIPELGESETSTSQIEYRVDIPTLNVENAKVRVGGTNLDHSLIQYPGTAMPGQLGSPVIFGHSVLRQFYNPSIKNPRRYNSIFSKIMILKPGDRIYVTHDDVRYTYIVREKREVKPDETFILEQNYQVNQLKLITCVPEGTYLRRGVIVAELETQPL